MSQNKKFEILQPLIIASMLALGMMFGYLMADKKAGISLFKLSKVGQDQHTGVVEEVYHLLGEKYLFNPDFKEIEDDALAHIFSNTDPFSVYVPPKDIEAVNNIMEGNFKGLGIEMLNIRDTLVVMDIIPGSPAQKIGLRKLDRIISLDNKDQTGKNLNINQFRKQVIKSKKKSLELGIFRKSSDEQLTLKFTPKTVETPSINQFFKWQDSVLYIKLDQFHSKTYQEFMLIMEKYQKEAFIPALIIDVRDNPGGYLNEVTKMLSEFFDDSDKLLVSTIVKDGRVKEYKSTGRSFYKFGKIIVLINENSASGSEILAGVIQDWDIGLVMGQKSYGKGLVQEQFPLSNGGAIRLTVANYYLPTGRSIQHTLDMDHRMFEPLNEKYSTNDTFKTLKKNRKIPVSEGVMPDLVIRDELIGFMAAIRSSENNTFDTDIIDLIEENPEWGRMSSGVFFEKFKFANKTLSYFRKYLPENSDNKSLEKLETVMKYRVGQLLFGKNEAFQFIKDHDPVIRAALKKINDPKWF